MEEQLSKKMEQKREETSLCCWVGLGNNHFFLRQLKRETLTKKYLNLKPVKNYFNKK